MRSLSSILHDCSVQTQMMLQWLAHSPMSREIDSEVGDLADDSFAGQKWATYLRYDVPFDATWLREHLDINISDDQAAEMFAIDRFDHSDLLAHIGEEAARHQIDPAHLAPEFDLV